MWDGQEGTTPTGSGKGAISSMIKAPVTAKYTTFVLESSSKVAVVGQLDVPRDRKKPTNHIHTHVRLYIYMSKLLYNDLVEQCGTR